MEYIDATDKKEGSGTLVVDADELELLTLGFILADAIFIKEDQEMFIDLCESIGVPDHMIDRMLTIFSTNNVVKRFTSVGKKLDDLTAELRGDCDCTNCVKHREQHVLQ